MKDSPATGGGAPAAVSVSAAVASAVESARSRRVCRVTVCRTQLLDMAPSQPRMFPSVAEAQAKTPVGSGMVPVRIFCTALLDRVSTEEMAEHGEGVTAC